MQSLAAVPGSTRTLFVGTSDGHVFGSHDSGEQWDLLGRIGEHHDDVIKSMVDDSDVMSVTIDQDNSAHIFASACSGIYHSPDGGAN
jgi:hypothetical protein